MSVFAVLALTLSALGIYGVLSYSVSQRRQELSVRMALGAERGAIVWLVIRQGVVLAAAGLTIGAAGGYALGRLLSGLLFGVTPTDLPTFAAVLTTVAFVALVACSLPARRAASTDLLGALRGEQRRRAQTGTSKERILGLTSGARCCVPVLKVSHDSTNRRNWDRVRYLIADGGVVCFDAGCGGHGVPEPRECRPSQCQD